MSTYGLRIRDAAGNVTLDITNKITRFRWSTISAVSGSQDLPDISGLQTAEFAVPLAGGVGHDISRSGTTISWTQASSPFTPANCIIFVFIYT